MQDKHFDQLKHPREEDSGKGRDSQGAVESIKKKEKSHAASYNDLSQYYDTSPSPTMPSRVSTHC